MGALTAAAVSALTSVHDELACRELIITYQTMVIVQIIYTKWDKLLTIEGFACIAIQLHSRLSRYASAENKRYHIPAEAMMQLGWMDKWDKILTEAMMQLESWVKFNCQWVEESWCFLRLVCLSWSFNQLDYQPTHPTIQLHYQFVTNAMKNESR